MNIFKNNKKGFTIIELLISVAIFAIMTGVLLAKYGNFNQSVILTNLAYDIALTIRTAQSYSINVKNSPTTDPTTRYSNDFLYPYGVHFSTTDPTHFVFFVDVSHDLRYSPSTAGEEISTYTISRGMKVTKLCTSTGSTNCTNQTSIDITFFRPNPEPNISAGPYGSLKYAYIEISSPDGQQKRKIEIGPTGKISIIDQ